MPASRNTLILPPAEYLHECFNYDPETGALTWKHRPQRHFSAMKIWKRWNTRYAGKAAGNIDSYGYLVVRIGNQPSCKAHRVIWKMMKGGEPPVTIDHKDGSRTNNRWSNLRAANGEEQQWNTGPQKNNSSGFKGIYRRGSRWHARIYIDGIHHWCGSFPSPQQAAVAYEKAARERQGGFYRQR